MNNRLLNHPLAPHQWVLDFVWALNKHHMNDLVLLVLITTDQYTSGDSKSFPQPFSHKITIQWQAKHWCSHTRKNVSGTQHNFLLHRNARNLISFYIAISDWYYDVQCFKHSQRLIPWVHDLITNGLSYSTCYMILPVVRISQKRTAAPSVLVWSPTTILGKALRCLNRTDRTGSLVFTWVWPQLLSKFFVALWSEEDIHNTNMI